MPVHERPQAAPLLAQEGRTGLKNACKTMHLMDAWLISLKIAGFAGIF